jgi:phosphate transport system substrate-binding protein
LSSLAAATLAAAGVFAIDRIGADPPPTAVDHDAAPTKRPEREEGVLHLGGSGSNLPLTRLLAREYERTRPVRVVVHESIGSTGGARATRDGAVDLGLVSRPLREAERDLERHDYARVAVVFAAHPSVVVDEVGAVDVLALWTGDFAHWPDGSRVVVLQREPGDSGSAVVAEAIPGFAAIEDEAREARRWPVYFHDQEIQEALTATPGAIGISDQGALRTLGVPVKLLAFEGRHGSAESVADGSYPLVKTLAFVSAGPASPEARDFIAFTRSPQAEVILREHGYVATGEP